MNVKTFRTNLITNFAARSAVTAIGGKAYRYPPGKSATNVPTLFLIDVENVTQNHFTLSGGTERIYLITGAAYAPTKGITDAQWATAEDNAQKMVDELTAELSEDPEQSIPGIHAHVTTVGWSPTSDPDTNRDYFAIEFTITVEDFTG